MRELKAIYLRGWLSPDTMINPGWLPVWVQSAQVCKEEGFGLVVFKVPLNKIGLADTETVEAIEKLLQERHGA